MMRLFRSKGTHFCFILVALVISLMSAQEAFANYKNGDKCPFCGNNTLVVNEEYGNNENDVHYVVCPCGYGYEYIGATTRPCIFEKHWVIDENDHFHCAGCGKYYHDLSHLSHAEAKAATCTEPGNIEYWYCTWCQKGYDTSDGSHEIQEGSWIIPALGHTEVVDPAIAATTTSDGKTEGKHCSVCKTILIPQQTIPRITLAPTSGSTSDPTLGNLTTLEEKAVGLKEKADLKGSTFRILQLKAKSVGKTSIKLGWKAVPKAAGYVVYGAGCGHKFVKLGDVTSTVFTHSGLKKGAYYWHFVAAYDANGNILAISKIAHIATSDGKKGNTKSVGINKKTVTLKKKQTFQLSAKLKNGKQKVSMHRKVAFESDKPKVATVTSSGKIKAVGKGSCTIYVYAQNGVFAKCKVRVK